MSLYNNKAYARGYKANILAQTTSTERQAGNIKAKYSAQIASTEQEYEIVVLDVSVHSTQTPQPIL